MTVDYLDDFFRWIAETLWPERCACCGHIGTAACGPCLRHIKPLTAQYCPTCSVPSVRGLPCPRCRDRSQVDRLIAATKLNPECEALVHAFKYRGITSLAAPLAGRMCDLAVRMPSATGLLTATPVIVPVPLHPSRLRERGYNQAELLAQRIARITALPLRTDLLVRSRPTHQQTKTSSRTERRENMQDAFTASGADGLNILLVDDVTTTGATLDGCARALKEAGAATVSAFTLAHG